MAADWDEWRGPHRDGTLIAEPKVWPEKLKLKWKVPVGEGHSSPILAGGSVYVFARKDGQETVYAIDPASGKVRWQQQYPAPYKVNPVAVAHGEGPKSTPVYSNGRLYTLGISGILSSFDAETGKLRWRKEFSKQYKGTSPTAGTATSPLVESGLLITQVGTDDDGAVTAFDVNSGQVKWSWNGDGTSYTSPVVVEAGGMRQLVTQTKTNIVGIDVSSGKVLWKIPFHVQYEMNIVTPLIYRDTLIFSGMDKGVMAVRLVRKGDEWTTQEVWRNQEYAMHLNSPVVNGDFVFGFSHKNKGQLFCLDARTGAKLWAGPPRDADNAALLVSASSLIELKNDGELVVAKPSGKSFDVVHRYTVSESQTWAHPVVLADGLLIQDANTLARWSVE
jgi:outer membrane protein assembly factor BamB